MRRRPFLVFMAVVGILVAGTVGFIQSAQFATLLKRAIVRYLPSDLGVDGDFSELSIRLFPPAISIRNPHLAVRKGNFVNLPAGSRIHAARMDFQFLPFQMFTGNIRVSKIRVVGGDISLAFDPEQGSHPKKGFSLRWDELFQIRADSFALERTQVRLSWPESKIQAEFLASDASVSQWKQGKQRGYELRIALKSIVGEFPDDWDVPTSGIESLEAHAIVTSEGVHVESVNALANGLRLSGEGMIRGDVLEPKGLTFEGGLKLVGTVPSLLEMLGDRSEAAQSAAGEVIFNGKVKAALDRPAKTLRAEGQLSVANFRYAEWEAGRIEAEGAWAPTGSDGEISLIRGSIESPERKRAGGFQSGGGGRVEIGGFKYRLGSTGPLTIPVKFSRVHLHWLAAPFLKSIYGLDFRTSGKVDVSFQPARAKTPWRIDANADLKLTEFQLDNQRLGETRELTRIVNVSEIELKGPFTIDSDLFQTSGMTLAAGQSKFLGIGKVDFNTGWDMNFEGDANLDDVGKIAENEIRGAGRLTAHVHGLGEKVVADFDVDMKDAYYLHMHLGALKGRITWDDDPSHLIFKGMELQQGRTRYVGGGLVDLGNGDTIAMKLEFLPGGRIEDLNRIFSELTQDLGWFPSSLTGGMSGALNITGGISLDRLKVLGHLSGSDWEYLAERFSHAEIDGGYDRGKYIIESFKATKPSGRVSARLSYDSNHETIDWHLQTHGFLVSDFDHVARLDVPIRGKLQLTSQGAGRMGKIDSETKVSLSDAAARGTPFPPSEATLTSTKGVTEFHLKAFGEQATLDGAYDFRPGAESRVRGELRSFDFSPALLLLNPKLIQDKNLLGQISGKMDLRFRTGEADRLSGLIAVSSYELAKTGARFKLADPVSVKIERGSFDLDRLVIQGPGGEAVLKARAEDAKLKGSVTGWIDASLAEFITPVVTQAVGRSSLDFRLRGELSSPLLAGTTTLEGGTVRIASVESPFENVMVKVRLNRNIIDVERIEADLANGRVSGGGKIELFVDRYPKIALTGQVNGSRLRVFPFQFVKLRGKLAVSGEQVPYVVSGDIVIDQGLSREKVMNQSQGRTLKSARFTPPPTARRVSDYPKFVLAINVRADQGLMIQNDLFDAELKAQIKIVNTIETPRLVGTADIVQGRMTFKDRVFTIQSASARFDNPAVINPAFNMTATTDVGNSKIQLYAAGRMDSFKVDLSSNPVMPESEILSLLALGATSEDVRKFKGGDRSAYEQGEAASLVLHSLDFNREVQNRTGFQIELDESVDNQTGSSVFRPRSDNDSAVAPKIVIKRRIGKKATVSVGSTVGVGNSNQKEVNLEYRVTPGFSLNGVWDTLEGVQADKEAQTSYGIDLKLQRRFK